MRLKQAGVIKLLMRKHIIAIHHKANAGAQAMDFMQMTTLFISYALCIIVCVLLVTIEHYYYKRDMM